ncbi:MAG: hypothetical protein AAF669_05925 [Pseudomonadota bacterium]
MKATLRSIDNNAGITFPAHVLRDWSAQLGDQIEIEIKKVTQRTRVDWDHATAWQGAPQARTQLLAGAPDPAFDHQEWRW